MPCARAQTRRSDASVHLSAWLRGIQSLVPPGVSSLDVLAAAARIACVMMSFALFWLRGGFLRSMVERHASELKVWRHTTHKLLGVRAEGPKRSRLYKDACVQCARGELPRRTMWSRSCTADCQRQAGTLWPSGVGVSMPSRSPRGTTTRERAP